MTPTPETIVARLRADLILLTPEERERCHHLLLGEVIEPLHGGKVRAFAEVLARQEAETCAEREKNSRRSRPEDTERNNQIVAYRKAKMTHGQIARKLGISEHAVRAVLTRRKKKPAK